MDIIRDITSLSTQKVRVKSEVDLIIQNIGGKSVWYLQKKRWTTIILTLFFKQTTDYEHKIMISNHPHSLYQPLVTFVREPCGDYPIKALPVKHVDSIVTPNVK